MRFSHRVPVSARQLLKPPYSERYASVAKRTGVNHPPTRFRVGTSLRRRLIMDVLSAYDLEAAYVSLKMKSCLAGFLCRRTARRRSGRPGRASRQETAASALSTTTQGGAVVRWLFDGMCGIHVAGENQFRIEPRPGGHFGRRASYRSVYGTVVSGWKKTDEGISILVTVPANCEAEVVLPDGRAVRPDGPGRENTHGRSSYEE